MKHIGSVSQVRPATAQGFLTKPGILGFNERGDWVIWAANFIGNVLPLGPWNPGVQKSGS